MARNFPSRSRIADTSQSRVTDTPNALGEYRSYRKAINSQGGTDGAPATDPTSADGFKIVSVAYGSAASDATRYEIFVGTNKTVRFEWYSSTGRTGYFSPDWATFPIGGTADAQQIGMHYGYDPTTGVAWVDAQRQTNACTTRNTGTSFPADGSGASSATSAYFDVIVTEL